MAISFYEIQRYLNGFFRKLACQRSRRWKICKRGHLSKNDYCEGCVDWNRGQVNFENEKTLFLSSTEGRKVFIENKKDYPWMYRQLGLMTPSLAKSYKQQALYTFILYATNIIPILIESKFISIVSTVLFWVAVFLIVIEMDKLKHKKKDKYFTLRWAFLLPALVVAFLSYFMSGDGYSYYR